MTTLPAQILAFWFEEAGAKRWYRKSDAFDSDIRARFEALALDQVALLQKSGEHPWEAEPDSTLALIILLDQFSRNMYRDTPAAFAWDAFALAAAEHMTAKGWDLKIALDRRAFIYMPYMHSEDMVFQDRCVYLVDSRLDDDSTLHHAKEHRKVIAKFGRFPHRNAILGRESTDAETTFLKSGGYSP